MLQRFSPYLGQQNHALEYLPGAQEIPDDELIRLLDTHYKAEECRLWLVHAARLGASLAVIMHLMKTYPNLVEETVPANEFATLSANTFGLETARYFALHVAVLGGASRDVLQVLYKSIPKSVRTNEKDRHDTVYICAKLAVNMDPFLVVTKNKPRKLLKWKVDIVKMYQMLDGPLPVLRAMLAVRTHPT
jgi:hypothetical protein